MNKNYKEEQLKSFKKILKKFDEDIKKKGYETKFYNEEWALELICKKKNHYRFKMTCFFSPESNYKSEPRIVLTAIHGLDLKSPMYFSIDGLSNLNKRYKAMFKEAEKYIDFELPKTIEDKREF